MEARILSLNSGHPETIEFEGKSLQSSMTRKPVMGPLLVNLESIAGNSFGSPAVHGVEHSVLYAFGLESALLFTRKLGIADYTPGLLGENVTLDKFDEDEISVGDHFEFGTVLAEATSPRIPCGKVSIRLRHPEGQKELQACGRSGIYFRVLRAGEIHLHSTVKRVKLAKERFPIGELYRGMVAGVKFSESEIERALSNGAFPKKTIARWAAEGQAK